MSTELTVDVVCAGSGLGALTAAIAAHDAGASVLVLEKADKLGGVCAYSGGEVFVPGNHHMSAADHPDEAAQGRAYLEFLAGGYADPELQSVLLDTAPVATRFLQEQAGVRFKQIAGFPDYHHPHAPGTAAAGRYLEVELFDGKSLGPWQRRTWGTPHMPMGITHDELFAWGGLAAIPRWDFATIGKRIAADQRGFGPGMMGWVIKAATVDRGIDTRVSTPVRRVLSEGGRVTGVVAEHEGRHITIRARKGVILAIGGYDWHPDFPKYFEGLPEWKSMIQPTVEGDNLLLGGELGAALAGVPPYNLGMFFGYRVPGEQHVGKPLWRASWEGGFPHAIWVDAAGRRFADESFYRDYTAKVHAWDGNRQAHPHYPPFLIFDQQFRDRYALATYLPGMPIPDSFAVKADTPAALADKLGVDAAGLEATLARFNQYAETGVDPDFGRGDYPWAAMMTGDRRRSPNQNLGPVCEPPFYGLPLRAVGVGVNAVGLRTDALARVQHLRGHPIEGLYAVGNAAAALDLGAGYQSGLSNARGITWGYIAGRHAAGAL